MLSNVNAYYEKMAESSDDDDEILDCHRICSGILRCAGRLRPNDVEGLSSQVTKRLETVAVDSPEQGVDLTPHVALLCLWGMTHDVAKSLASSIASAFDTDDSLIFPPSGGRRRSSRKQRSTSRDPTALPTLPPSVALTIIEDVLRGADPSSLAARDALLSSAPSCTEIQNALRQGTTFMERVLVSHENVTADDVAVEIALRTCEAYGRLALHQVALSNKDGPMPFSQHARLLLQWTTDWVVPVFTQPDPSSNAVATPMQDLELSRISNATLTPMFASPAPHQLAINSCTPKHLGSAVSQLSIDNGFLGRPTNMVAEQASISLFHSTCLIFSEWVAVGGGGADEIATAATEWSSLFGCHNQRRTSGSQTSQVQEVLPAFLRLAFQICKSHDDTRVLGALLCTEIAGISSEAKTMTQKAVASLLRFRDSDSVLLQMVVDVAEAALCLQGKNTSCSDDEKENSELEDSIEDDDPETPTSWETVWQWTNGLVPAALTGLVSNKHASLLFASRLAGIVRQEQGPSLLAAKCLWFMSSCSPTRAAVQSMMNTLESFGNDNGNATNDQVEHVLAQVRETIAL